MPADKLRPEDIDAAIAASQGQGRRHGQRLDPGELTPIEESYRSRSRYDADDPAGGLRDSLGGVSVDPAAGDPGIPPYPEKPRPDVVYAEPGARFPGSRRRWPMLVAGLALGAFAAIIWWAYGTEPPGDAGPVPLITAEQGAAKVRPEREGGLQVPFQDKLIYSQIEPDPDRDPVERLLPPPPDPVEPPEAPPVEARAIESAPADGPPAGPSVVEAGPLPADAAAPATAAEATVAEEGGAPAPPAAPTVPVQAVPIGEAAEEAEPPATAVAEPADTPPAPPAKPEAARPQPAPAEAAAPQLAQAAGAFRVQLAAFRSPDAAKTAWTTLRGRHPELLEPLKLSVIRADLGDKGIFYRVQAGPLADRAAARALCDRLQERDQACLVVAP